MTTVFPGAVDSFSVKVDNVTQVLAAHINDVQDSIVAIETAVIAQSPNANLLYHTLSHDIWPGGTTFNDVTDDSYVAGLWNAIHNGQNPDVTGEAAVIDGSKRAIRCTFDSASSQAGFVQFLSNEDTVLLRGKTLSFSIDTNTLNVANMRCAILEWVGTADTITSDVVATWGAGNPTLATSWSYIGTPADQAISGTTRIKAEGKVIGATTNNLAVFIWNPAVEASTDYFRLANAKLEIGLTATAFVAPDVSEEWTRVDQFYNIIGLGHTGGWVTAALADINLDFHVRMRTNPTVTLTTTTPVIDELGGSQRTGTASTASLLGSSLYGAIVRVDGFTGATIGRLASPLSDFFIFNARL